MEPAKINWESLESVFILDQIYENINAPQWVDFLAPDHHSQQCLDDEAWFCRPDCKHPKTAEDFLKSTPTSKLLRSVSVSKLIGLGDWTRREGDLKRRGLGQDQEQCKEENVNENPNFSTPNHQIKAFKSKFKSSAQESTEEHEEEEEDQYSEILLRSDEKSRPKLRSTQSARDLFGGKDIFNKISEFCNELKRMASWVKEKEVEEAEKLGSSSDRNPLEVSKKHDGGRDVLGAHSEKERKPFLEVCKERSEVSERSIPKKKQLMRKKKILDDEAENIPVSLDLNRKDMKHKDKERLLLPIRTNPPTPQGFSANRDPIKTTPSKGPKSGLMEREILQEVGQRTLREELGEKSHSKNAPSPTAGREGRGLDVFWFLKPCTLSS